MKPDIIKWILFGLQFCVVLGLLAWFPWVQNQLPSLQVPELWGAYTVEQKPVFFLNSWLSGRYQDRTETYVQEDRHTRPLLLRLKNQRTYDWFGKSPNAKIVFGKDEYLFNKLTINNWLGRDAMKEEEVQNRISKLAAIQSYLAQRGTQLLVALPPSKATFIPENLPSFAHKANRSKNSREKFREALEAEGIQSIFFDHFMEDKSREPFLYPRGGLHYSHVGATFAMDTIAKRIEALLSIPLSDIHIDAYEYSQEIRIPDNELVSVLNLYRPYREEDSMIYPIIRYERDSSDAKPNLLILGDSFYHNLMRMGFHKELFSPQSTYWNYFNRIITPENDEGTHLNKDRLNLLKEVENRDLLLLMVADINLHQFGYGFVEALYEKLPH